MAKNFDRDKAFEIFNNKKKKSEKILNNKGKVFSKIGRAATKANLLKTGSFGEVFEDFKLLLELIRAYTNKEYTGVPKGIVVAALAGVLYFLSPVDVIFDFIPGLGYIDDVFVISYVVKKIHEELQIFKEWRDNRFM